MRVEILTSVGVSASSSAQVRASAGYGVNEYCLHFLVQQMSSDGKSPVEHELASLRSEVAALRAQVATLRKIRAQVATLREEVSDLRASAEWWRTLYEAAIRRGAEREQK
jgi:hypothetical protein